MKKGLKRIVLEVYYFSNGSKIVGIPTSISGDPTSISGDLTSISGDLSGISGNLTGISGDLSGCQLTNDERKNGIDISELVE